VTISRYRDTAVFLLLGFIWGATFPAVEVGLRAFDPVVLAAIRYDIGAVLLVVFVVVTMDDWKPATAADLVGIASAGVLYIALGGGLMIVAQVYTTGSVAGVMFSLIPLLTVAFSWIVLPSERPSLVGFAGLLIGFGGVVTLINPSPAALQDTATLGKALLFIGGVAAALGSVLVRRARTTLSVTVLTAWGMVLGGLLLHGYVVAAGKPLTTAPLTLPVVGAIVYLTTVSTAVAYALYFSLLQRFTAFEVNLVQYVIPVVAMVLGHLLLDEAITLPMIAGFVAIALGFTLVRRRQIADELDRYFSRA